MNITLDEAELEHTTGDSDGYLLGDLHVNGVPHHLCLYPETHPVVYDAAQAFGEDADYHTVTIGGRAWVLFVMPYER